MVRQSTKRKQCDTERGFKDFNQNYEYRTRNETISANSPVASARANPRIANENSCPLRAGFRAVDEISDEKICPIPIPAPVSPIAASPAPMYFAAANMVELSCIYVLLPIYENIQVVSRAYYYKFKCK